MTTNRSVFTNKMKVQTDAAVYNRSKRGQMMRCNKEGAMCAEKDCPHKGSHLYHADCLRSICMSDQKEISVECVIVEEKEATNETD